VDNIDGLLNALQQQGFFEEEKMQQLISTCNSAEALLPVAKLLESICKQDSLLDVPKPRSIATSSTIAHRSAPAFRSDQQLPSELRFVDGQGGLMSATLASEMLLRLLLSDQDTDRMLNEIDVNAFTSDEIRNILATHPIDPGMVLPVDAALLAQSQSETHCRKVLEECYTALDALNAATATADATVAPTSTSPSSTVAPTSTSPITLTTDTGDAQQQNSTTASSTATTGTTPTTNNNNNTVMTASQMTAIAERKEIEQKMMVSYEMLSTMYRERGEFRQALAFHKAFLGRAKQWKDSMSLLRGFQQYGLTFHTMGSFDDAIASYKQSLVFANQLRSKRHLLDLYRLLSEAYADKSVLQTATQYHQLYEELLAELKGGIDDAKYSSRYGVSTPVSTSGPVPKGAIPVTQHKLLFTPTKHQSSSSSSISSSRSASIGTFSAAGVGAAPRTPSTSSFAAATTRSEIISSAADYLPYDEPDTLGHVIILDLLCAMLPYLTDTSLKLTCLDSFVQISHFADDEIRLQRLIPCLVSYLDSTRDPSALVRAQTIKTLAHVITLINEFPIDDAHIFQDYLIPVLKFVLKEERETIVHQAFAEALPKLATSARLCLDHSQLHKHHHSTTSNATPSASASGMTPSASNAELSSSGASQTPSGAASVAADDRKKDSVYENDLRELRQMFHEILTEWLENASVMVKRTVLEDIGTLAQFFGPEGTNNHLLQLIFSWLNFSEWELKCAVFDNLVGVSQVAGPDAVESYIESYLPIHDESEFVIDSAVNCLASLTASGIFAAQRLRDYTIQIAPLLLHPNAWIRFATVNFMVQIGRRLSPVEVQCFIIPHLRKFLTHDITNLSQPTLLHAMHAPVSRSAYERVMTSLNLNGQQTLQLQQQQQQSSLVATDQSSSSASTASTALAASGLESSKKQQSLSSVESALTANLVSSSSSTAAAAASLLPSADLTSSSVPPADAAADSSSSSSAPVASNNRRFTMVSQDSLNDFVVIEHAKDGGGGGRHTSKPLLSAGASAFYASSQSMFALGAAPPSVSPSGSLGVSVSDVSSTSSTSTSTSFAFSDKALDLPYSLGLAELDLEPQDEEKLFWMKEYVKEARRTRVDKRSTLITDSWAAEYTRLSREKTVHDIAQYLAPVQTATSAIMPSLDTTGPDEPTELWKAMFGSSSSLEASKSSLAMVVSPSPSSTSLSIASPAASASSLAISTVSSSASSASSSAVVVAANTATSPTMGYTSTSSPVIGTVASSNLNMAAILAAADEEPRVTLLTPPPPPPPPPPQQQQQQQQTTTGGTAAPGSVNNDLSSTGTVNTPTRDFASSSSMPPLLRSADPTALNLGTVRIAKVSSSGSSLASDGWVPQGVLVATLSEHEEAVTQLQVAKDGAFFASGSHDGKVKIWDSLQFEHNGPLRSASTYYGLGSAVTSIAICQDSHSVAAASIQGSIHVFRVDAGVPGQKDSRGMSTNVVRRLDQSDGVILKLEHFDKGNESIIAYATDRGDIRTWDLRSQKEPWAVSNSPHLGLITSLMIDPGRNWLAVGTDAGNFTCWDIRFRVPLLHWSLPVFDGLSGIHALAHDPVQPGCFWASFGPGLVGHWNLETSECKKLLRVAPRGAATTSSSTNGVSSSNSSSSSTSQKTGASIDWDSILVPKTDIAASGDDFRIADLQRPLTESARSLESHLNTIRAVTIAPNGKFALTGGADKKLRFWNFDNPQRSFIISGKDPREEVSYNIWESASKNIGGLEENRTSIRDSPFIASTPKLPSTGHCDTILDIKLLELHSKKVMAVSASRDGVIKVWK